MYDRIVNPSVLIECKEDKTGKHRDFICQLAIQSLEQKYNEDLDRRYTLPKLKYMGTITSQHVRDRKSEPKIEEVSSSSAQSKAKPKPRPIQVVEVDLPYALKWLKQDKTDEDIDDNIFDGHKGDYIEPTMRVDDSILSFVFYSKICTHLLNTQKRAYPISAFLFHFFFSIRLGVDFGTQIVWLKFGKKF